MGSRYYQQGGERASKVRALFDAIAPRYDLVNDLQSFGLHRLWKRRLAKLGRVESGARVLDVCSGTGDVAFCFARAGAEVLGVDFSERMLAVAERRRSGMKPAPPVVFVRGDALNLPFGDGQFDRVTIGYGLRNLADFEAGVGELCRVCKAGGRILVLEFGVPGNAIWRRLYFTYLKLAVPLFGRIFCGDSEAYSYILESLKHYPAQEGVAKMFESLGCEEVRVTNLVGGVMSIHLARKA